MGGARQLMITGGQLLGRWLRVRGVDAVYGRPLPGLPVVEVDDPSTGRLLALAHRRVHGVAAAVHGPGGRLSVPRPDDAADAPAVSVDSAADLLDLSGARQVTVELGFD
ncbi:MAG TPA: hypothetical protein VG476_08895, partial [Acidimicrobiales bacterium]|nr:hypothetical protein [Acidimicrobiales bacterium]